jgi:hypothetical protein
MREGDVAGNSQNGRRAGSGVVCKASRGEGKIGGAPSLGMNKSIHLGIAIS